MVFSVWRPAIGRYDYFETPALEAEFYEPAQPKHLKGGAKGVGVSVERATWALPSNAVHTGQGTAAKGMIAQKHSAMGAFDPIRSVPFMPLLALVAVVWIWRKEFA